MLNGKKLIDPIRQRGAKEALQELKKENYMKLEHSDGDVMKLRLKNLKVYKQRRRRLGIIIILLSSASLRAIGQAKNQRHAKPKPSQPPAVLKLKAQEIKAINRRQRHPFWPSISRIPSKSAVLSLTHFIDSVA